MYNYKTDESRDILIDNKWILTMVLEASPQNPWLRTESSRCSVKIQIPEPDRLLTKFNHCNSDSGLCILTNSSLIPCTLKSESYTTALLPGEHHLKVRITI